MTYWTSINVFRSYFLLKTPFNIITSLLFFCIFYFIYIWLIIHQHQTDNYRKKSNMFVSTVTQGLKQTMVAKEMLQGLRVTARTWTGSVISYWLISYLLFLISRKEQVRHQNVIKYLRTMFQAYHSHTKKNILRILMYGCCYYFYFFSVEA